MTVREILKIALSLSSTVPGDSDVDDFVVDWLNIALGEALPCENSIRESKKQKRLIDVPFVKGLDDNINFSDNLCRVSLPYALASYIFMDGIEDSGKSGEFRNKFIISLGDFSKINFGIGGE